MESRYCFLSCGGGTLTRVARNLWNIRFEYAQFEGGNGFAWKKTGTRGRRTGTVTVCQRSLSVPLTFGPTLKQWVHWDRDNPITTPTRFFVRTMERGLTMLFPKRST